MKRLSERRGVISVFLLIIFSVTVVFMGMLVDAARYRMAQTYVETSLDSATESILAEYNSLLFDLYGLLSVDLGAADGADMEKKIKERYEHYLNTTLGIMDLDTSTYKTLLSKAIETVKEEAGKTQAAETKDKTPLTAASLYDFSMTDLTAGSVVTLADTANVENQLIEYMKFRAPLELVSDMSGFLGKLKEILTMRDRINEGIQRENLKQNLGKPADDRAETTMRNIEGYVINLKWFARNPANRVVTEDAPYDMGTISGECNRAVSLAQNQYLYCKNNAKRNAEEWYEPELQDNMMALVQLFQEQLKLETEELELTSGGKYYDADEKETKDFTKIDWDVTERKRDAGKKLDWKAVAEEVLELVQDKAGKKYEAYPEHYQEILDEAEKAINEKIEELKKDARDNFCTSVQEALVNTEKILEEIVEKATDLYRQTVDLCGDGTEDGEIQAAVAQYKDYIDVLETRNNSEGVAKGMYEGDIQIAKANAGKLLQYLDLLTSSRAFLDDFRNGKLKFEGIFSSVYEKVNELRAASEWEDSDIDNVVIMVAGLAPVTERIPVHTPDAKNLKGYSAPDASANLFRQIQGIIEALYNNAEYYRKLYSIQEDGSGETEAAKKEKDNLSNKVKENKSAGKEDAKEKEVAAEVDVVKKGKAPLQVNYTHSVPVSTVEDEDALAGEVDENLIKNVLEMGSRFLDAIENMLEGARDNLYINAYVMTMFPNYNVHYVHQSDNGSEKLLKTPYKPQLASYAEVEYILTGASYLGENRIKDDGGFGVPSVTAMRLKLYTTRLLLNLVSMFTDGTKYSQASTLSAWAGPFAGLVAIIIMVAWTLVETALDVAILMGDADFLAQNGGGLISGGDDTKGMKKIAVYKLKDDWLLSLEGLAQAAATALIDVVMEKATSMLSDKASKLLNSMETKMNEMIYDAYAAASDKMTGAVNDVMDTVKTNGSEMLSNWGNALQENIDRIPPDGVGEDIKSYAQQEADAIVSTINGSFTSTMDEIKGEINNEVIGKPKEWAAVGISRAKERLLEKANEKIDSLGSAAKEEANDFIKKNLTKVLPSADSGISGGGSANHCLIQMGYTDYLYLFLFMTKNEVKVQRIQSVIQANMQGKDGSFKMELSPASVWADVECTMKYLFMSDSLMPENIKRNGKMRLKAISAQSY